ncbi:hypothetical protein D3C87_2088100 [compost metagenome]
MEFEVSVDHGGFESTGPHVKLCSSDGIDRFCEVLQKRSHQKEHQNFLELLAILRCFSFCLRQANGDCFAPY